MEGLMILNRPRMSIYTCSSNFPIKYAIRANKRGHFEVKIWVVGRYCFPKLWWFSSGPDEYGEYVPYLNNGFLSGVTGAARAGTDRVTQDDQGR